jgi:hypothetical protein
MKLLGIELPMAKKEKKKFTFIDVFKEFIQDQNQLVKAGNSKTSLLQEKNQNLKLSNHI